MIRRLYNWLRPRPPEKPKVTKKPKPSRVSVHLRDGRTIVHYAEYREISDNGGLCLHCKPEGGNVVADYAAGEWVSLSVGKRAVQPHKPNPKR